MEKKDLFDLFVDHVSNYVLGLFDYDESELTISSNLSDSHISFEFGCNIQELSCFQTIMTILTNIGSRYGFKPSSFTLCAVDNTLVYTVQMMNL
jgi:hypothetical protein